MAYISFKSEKFLDKTIKPIEPPRIGGFTCTERSDLVFIASVYQIGANLHEVMLLNPITQRLIKEFMIEQGDLPVAVIEEFNDGGIFHKFSNLICRSLDLPQQPVKGFVVVEVNRKRECLN